LRNQGSGTGSKYADWLSVQSVKLAGKPFGAGNLLLNHPRQVAGGAVMAVLKKYSIVCQRVANGYLFAAIPDFN